MQDYQIIRKKRVVMEQRLRAGKPCDLGHGEACCGSLKGPHKHPQFTRTGEKMSWERIHDCICDSKMRHFHPEIELVPKVIWEEVKVPTSEAAALAADLVKGKKVILSKSILNTDYQLQPEDLTQPTEEFFQAAKAERDAARAKRKAAK